jgi:hypothetical protein
MLSPYAFEDPFDKAHQESSAMPVAIRLDVVRYFKLAASRDVHIDPTALLSCFLGCFVPQDTRNVLT